MPERKAGNRPYLILYVARYECAQKNAVAATLAWMAETQGYSFDVYYDAVHAGRHYGGGDPQDMGPGSAHNQAGLALLTGGPISGGRHLEALALALLRFETTVICSGRPAFSNTLAALAEDSGAKVHEEEEESVAALYSTMFSALTVPWPDTAVMVNAAPTPELEGIDAYCYPEIFYRRAVGIEASAHPAELKTLHANGVRRILTCGIPDRQQEVLQELGFEVSDLGIVCDGDDYASVTSRLADRWKDRRQGWIIGDPTLVSYWIPTACRERRAAIFSIPHSRVMSALEKDIAANSTPVLGRQYEDSDFFTLSRLGQSFQVIDPCRPTLPVLQSLPSRWASTGVDSRTQDPDDDALRAYARQGRILTSLVFWTGMIRETENLYALMDLISLTGLRAGFVLTSQSLSWHPSPLDLLTVPRDQGGVFPHVEILLGGCGNGVAIESLLTPAQLGGHLLDAKRELERLGLPRPLWPEGWWSTMDAPMIPLTGRQASKRVRWNPVAPYYVQIRYHPRDKHRLQSRVEMDESMSPVSADTSSIHSGLNTRVIRERLRGRIRDSRLQAFFAPYRPYENFEPGPIIPDLATTIQQSGFSYMLTKSGFEKPPQIMHRDGDFVALNYTAGQWDGWTPFETINNVRDLRRSERTLLASGKPGWLLGEIDACLRAFAGELWEGAPELMAMARHVASGGSSGKLINVAPRVLARYARIIDDETNVFAGKELAGRASA